MQSAIPAFIFAVAMAMVSRPDAQYRLTVTPPTLNGKPARNTIIRPICMPCSASGIALPQIKSSIRDGSKFGTDATKCFTTSAPKSSGR